MSEDNHFFSSPEEAYQDNRHTLNFDEKTEHQGFFSKNYLGIKNAVENAESLEEAFFKLGLCAMLIKRQIDDSTEPSTNEMISEYQKLRFVLYDRHFDWDGGYEYSDSMLDNRNDWLFNFEHLTSFYNAIFHTRLKLPFEEFCLGKPNTISVRVNNELEKLFKRESMNSCTDDHFDNSNKRQAKINWTGSKNALIRFVTAFFDEDMIEKNDGNRDWQLISEVFLHNGEPIDKKYFNSKCESLMREKAGQKVSEFMKSFRKI